MGGPHGGGGPHGTPLRLGTRSRHARRAPRGAPLHGGRQRQIRGSVPSRGARVLQVRIHLPPAESQVRTCLSREFAFLRREAAVSAGLRLGRAARRRRVRHDAPSHSAPRASCWRSRSSSYSFRLPFETATYCPRTAL